MTVVAPTAAAPIRRLARAGEDPAHIRNTMAHFPSGIAALCAIVDDRPVGMVASSFSVGVSYSPPMVLFSVQNSSTTWPILERAARIGVSVLGDDQSAACMQLASRAGDRFEGLSTITTDDGAVLIDGASMWLDCEIASTTPAGDHRIVVLEVHALSIDGARAPLIYHERRFHSLRRPLT